jgi:D-tyrosyl-tRNA(Tyr) deacylase
MKIIVQRVRQGRVTVDPDVVGQIGRGLVVLVGVRHGDTEESARYLAHRTVHLRIFPDDAGRMNRSVEDIAGEVLAVSQFTLYADTRKGNRPGFTDAAEPGLASRLYDLYVDSLRAALGAARVATGRFGASMLVELANDGPVTIEINTDEVRLENRSGKSG